MASQRKQQRITAARSPYFMTGFIELNSGEGQPDRVLATEIARIQPRYDGLFRTYLAGSVIHMKNCEPFDVVEVPELVLRKIKEAK